MLISYVYTGLPRKKFPVTRFSKMNDCDWLFTEENDCDWLRLVNKPISVSPETSF